MAESEWRWDDRRLAVPFSASVVPAWWSSSSLVFKLFPIDAPLPGRERGGWKKREEIISTKGFPRK